MVPLAWETGQGRRSRDDRAEKGAAMFGSVRPDPLPDLGRVVTELTRIGSGGDAPVRDLLAKPGGALVQAGYAVDHVHHQVEAVEVVEHDHVEGSRGRPLLLVAPDVEIVV